MPATLLAPAETVESAEFGRHFDAETQPRYRTSAEIISTARKSAIKDGHHDQLAQSLYIERTLAIYVDVLARDNASLRAELREAVTV